MAKWERSSAFSNRARYQRRSVAEINCVGKGIAKSDSGSTGIGEVDRAVVFSSFEFPFVDKGIGLCGDDGRDITNHDLRTLRRRKALKDSDGAAIAEIDATASPRNHDSPRVGPGLRSNIFYSDSCTASGI